MASVLSVVWLNKGRSRVHTAVSQAERGKDVGCFSIALSGMLSLNGSAGLLVCVVVMCFDVNCGKEVCVIKISS